MSKSDEARGKVGTYELPEHVYAAIHRAIGTASVCWTVTSTGVFEIERAADLAADLCLLFAAEVRKARGSI